MTARLCRSRALLTRVPIKGSFRTSWPNELLKLLGCVVMNHPRRSKNLVEEPKHTRLSLFHDPCNIWHAPSYIESARHSHSEKAWGQVLGFSFSPMAAGCVGVSLRERCHPPDPRSGCAQDGYCAGLRSYHHRGRKRRGR